MSWYNPLSWGADPKVDLDPAKVKLQSGGYIRDMGQQQISSVMGRQAPQASKTHIGQVAQAPVSGQFRQGQVQLADRLSSIASGQQAGAGELAARRMTDRGIAQQAGTAASMRGSNAALGALSAARGQTDIAAAGMQQAREAALQDQQSAMGQLGQVYGQGRQGDIQVGLANMDAQNQRTFQQAQLNQATSLANAEARLRMQGMNDQAINQYLGQLYNVDAAEMQALLEQDKMRVAQRSEGYGADLIAAAGPVAAAAASDRRLKKDVVSGETHLSELFSAKPYSYEYKDDKWGKGRRTSPMAQDLEKSSIGKAMVSETDKGEKIVDYGKGLGSMFAGISWLNRRLKKLEGDR